MTLFLICELQIKDLKPSLTIILKKLNASKVVGVVISCIGVNLLVYLAFPIKLRGIILSFLLTSKTDVHWVSINFFVLMTRSFNPVFVKTN